MHRFFTDVSNIDTNTLKIVGDDVQHISKVLRIRCGDSICVCDKSGTDYLCVVSSITKTEVLADITEKSDNHSESNLNITLYQGVPKGDKMELIIQKCVELGVKKIVPVVMKRTVVKLKNISLKTERWQKVAVEAAKQSGRGMIPAVCNPMEFESVVNEINNSGSLNILPYENEEETGIKKILRNNKQYKNINIIIGPEGGFDEEEILLSKNADINIVTLGPRILRCETAPIAAVSAVMYELGDWC